MNDDRYSGGAGSRALAAANPFPAQCTSVAAASKNRFARWLDFKLTRKTHTAATHLFAALFYK